MDKKQALEQVLLKELKSAYHVKGFVKEWREFGIDVGNINIINRLEENNLLLLTMISYYSLGVTSKFIEVIKEIKG